MLPFQDLKNKKVYTCFCCGIQFKENEFENFKKHIIDEHEEGRDYLLCPLNRCKTPVRCLKTHFASKHPNEKMPKFKQNRSIIWKDVGGKKHKKPKFQDGDFFSQKNGREVHYRSSYERKVYELLEMWPDVVSYFGENCLKINYFIHGEQHYYLPDLQIIFTDGHIEVWEIKPATQTSMPINVAKRNAAIAYCETRNWKFQTITEKGIELLKNKVKLLMNEGK
jgi:hypothetical protein